MDAKFSKKLVVVGDGGCGKTCLLLSFSQNKMPDEYVPTIFDTYTKTFKLGKKWLALSLFDTAGQDAYDRLRPLTYPDTDVVLVCYSAVSPDSFYNANDKWIPEVNHFCPNTPVILVCTKVDLRDDVCIVKKLSKVRQEPVSASDGIKLSKSAKALAFIECSAKEGLNINKVFRIAAKASLKKRKARKMDCVFL